MADSGFAAISRTVLKQGGLSGYAKLVYALIVAHINGANDAWPSQYDLADESGWSRPTVRRAIRELIAAGLIVQEHRRFENHYRLTDEKWLPATKETTLPPSGGTKETTLPPSTATEETTLPPSTTRRKRQTTTEETSDHHGGNDVSFPELEPRTRANELEPEVHTPEPLPASPEEAHTPGGVGGRSTREEVEAVFEYYRERVQPRARLTAGARQKITARLRTYSVDELAQGIDQFAIDDWWMEHNAQRGAEWFFHSDARSEQFVLLTPKVRDRNGHAKPQYLDVDDPDDPICPNCKQPFQPNAGQVKCQFCDRKGWWAAIAAAKQGCVP